MKIIKLVFQKIKQLLTDFLRFLVISALLLLILLAFNYVIEKSNFQRVAMNGEKYPISSCINSMKFFIKNTKQRNEFCKCFYQKILQDPILKSKYQDALKKNNLYEVIKELEKDNSLSEIEFKDCVATLNINWNKSLENAIKKHWKNGLGGSTFENTNNIDNYCNCLMKHYRKYPFTKLIEDSFNGIEGNELDVKCSKLSKKRKLY